MNDTIKLSSLLLCCFFLLTATAHKAHAQWDSNALRNYQLSMPRVSKAYSLYNEKLRAEFTRKGFRYPPNNIYLRSFKAHNELEVWVKDDGADTYALFKTYKICALSGSLGPKRWEGDLQVPEGLYFIADFNPNSDFYLSMLVNYPNYSDLVLGNKQTPGGDIYIHGGCVTVGCLPMTDAGIQEIYTLCLNARMNGQTNIPVHIFPVRFNRVGLNFLGKAYENDEAKQRFWINLKAAYDHFEKNHKLFPVMYNQDGKYIF